MVFRSWLDACVISSSLQVILGSVYILDKSEKILVAQEENDSFGKKNNNNYMLSECWWTEKCNSAPRWKFHIQDPRPKRPTKCHAWNLIEVTFFPFLTFSWKKSTWLSSPLSWRYLSSTEPWFVGLSESSGRNFTRRISSFYNPSQLFSMRCNINFTKTSVKPHLFPIPKQKILNTWRSKSVEPTKVPKVHQSTGLPCPWSQGWHFGERLGFWCLPFIGGWLYTVDFCWVSCWNWWKRAGCL